MRVQGLVFRVLGFMRVQELCGFRVYEGLEAMGV